MAATTVLNDTRDPTRTQAAAACLLAAQTPGRADGSLPSLGSLQLSSAFGSLGGDVLLLLLLLPSLLALWLRCSR